jgi:hypothetical protein
MKAGCVLRFRMEELAIMQLSGECVECQYQYEWYKATLAP